jgi:hypothetical protein
MVLRLCNKNKFKTIILLLGFIMTVQSAFPQSNYSLLPASDKFNRSRFIGVVGVEAGLGLVSLIGLNQVWYIQYKHRHFHFFNDNKEWLQMDKMGHAFTSYTIGRFGYGLLRWSGVGEHEAIWYGGSLGLAYLSGIEVLDGFSDGWGFSRGDMLANTLGAALFIGQQAAWHEQRFALLFSYHPSTYAPMRPEILGSNFLERIIKDYNGQTYWLTANIHSLLHGHDQFPAYIDASFGYGAEGMISGFESNDHVETISRYRKYFLSASLNPGGFNYSNNLGRALAYPLSIFKVPAPALAYKQKKLYFKPLWF